MKRDGKLSGLVSKLAGKWKDELAAAKKRQKENSGQKDGTDNQQEQGGGLRKAIGWFLAITVFVTVFFSLRDISQFSEVRTPGVKFLVDVFLKLIELAQSFMEYLTGGMSYRLT